MKLNACEQTIKNLKEQEELVIGSNVDNEDQLKNDNEQLKKKKKTSEQSSVNTFAVFPNSNLKGDMMENFIVIMYVSRKSFEKLYVENS